MNLFLLALGILVTAAGCLMVGFGIPINAAFSLGNTLLISGAVTISCGLILIALAMAVGQLRRIAEALNTRALAGAVRAPETVEALVPPTARLTPAAPASPVPTRVPTPPKVMEPEGYPPEPRPVAQRPPEPPRQFEPRFPNPAPSDPPGPLDWLRAKSRPGPQAPMSHPVDPPMVEVQDDDTPLSPRPPLRTPMPPEPVLEPKMWSSPGRGNGAPEPRPLRRAAPQPEPPKEPEPPQFDSVWDRPDSGPAEAKRETGPDLPPPGAPRRDERPAERRGDSIARPIERTPTILKSGVIDGMPYTLYADGSIEAQLPQGTVKFASVDALRAHLEK